MTRLNRKSLLFRVPTEIRDMIYDFVVLGTCMPQQEFIDLGVPLGARFSRWKRRRLQRLHEVCRDFRDELLDRFLGLNIVRMTLHASDFSGDLILRKGKVIATKHLFMAFLERVEHFALHHEGGLRPFWKDTPGQAGILLVQSMPQLHELTIYPTEETTHLDGDFLFFVQQVLMSHSLKRLIFFDTFGVVEESDFEWAKEMESTRRIEVACLRPDKPVPGPVRRENERFDDRDLLGDWPCRERYFSVMGIQFTSLPSLAENNRVKFVIA